MKAIKLFIVLALAVFGYQYWNKHHPASGTTVRATSAESQNGFIALPAVNGASTKAVLIIAAENCPEEAAQRADQLAEQLARDGIPVSRLHDVNFTIQNGDPAAMDRLTSVMNSELPIVFVNGRAKSNPKFEEIVAEYNRTKH